DQSFHEFPEPHLRIRGLADGTVHFEKDDVANTKILPAYTRMLTNRGKYLALNNQPERAVAAFKEALALDPNLAEAWKGLTESAAKVRNPEHFTFSIIYCQRRWLPLNRRHEDHELCGSGFVLFWRGCVRS